MAGVFFRRTFNITTFINQNPVIEETSGALAIASFQGGLKRIHGAGRGGDIKITQVRRSGIALTCGLIMAFALVMLMALTLNLG